MMQGLQVVQPGLEQADRTSKIGHYLDWVELEVATPSPKRNERVTLQRNPFGLSPLAFGALVSFVTALVICGIVAASLGIILSKCQHNSHVYENNHQSIFVKRSHSTDNLDYQGPQPPVEAR
jgi:hypothetical protein